MTFTQQDKLLVFCINMNLPRIGHYFKFGGHFRYYINYYKSSTFLIPYKTFVDIFIDLLQVTALNKCLKRFFPNEIATIVKLATIVSIKRKPEMET